MAGCVDKLLVVSLFKDNHLQVFSQSNLSKETD